MADRYLLESGAPDGYLLEDGTGVLLLENTPPFMVGEVATFSAPWSSAHRQIRNFPVPNLLTTTLAASPVGEVLRSPLVVNTRKQWPQISPAQVPTNLLLTTLSVVANTYNWNPSGSITFSGTSVRAWQRTYSPSGAIQFTGTVTSAREKVFQVSGQLTLTGTAPFSAAASYLWNPSGTVVLSGTTILARVRVVNTSGGLNLIGTTSVLRERRILTSGEITFFGGVNRFVREKIMPSSGGVSLTGSAPFIFTSSGGPTSTVLSRISLFLSRAMRLS